MATVSPSTGLLLGLKAKVGEVHGGAAGKTPDKAETVPTIQSPALYNDSLLFHRSALHNTDVN